MSSGLQSAAVAIHHLLPLKEGRNHKGISVGVETDVAAIAEELEVIAVKIEVGPMETVQDGEGQNMELFSKPCMVTQMEYQSTAVPMVRVAMAAAYLAHTADNLPRQLMDR